MNVDGSKKEKLMMSTQTWFAFSSKRMLWVSYILSALPALLLLFSGTMKLMRPPSVIEGFVRLGYDEGLALGIGIVELLCTVLYLVPRTSVLGAILLTGFLGGATATHVRMGEPFYAAVLLGLLVWGGLFMRDEQLRVLIPLRK